MVVGVTARIVMLKIHYIVFGVGDLESIQNTNWESW